MNILERLNIQEESIEKHLDEDGNTYRILVLSKGENLFFQENDKYLLCLVDAVHGVIEVDTITKWEPNQRMSPMEKERVVGLVEKYYRKVYDPNLQLISRRERKRNEGLKTLINKVRTVDTELVASYLENEKVEINLKDPNWQKESEKRMNAFFNEYGSIIQEVTA